MLPRTLLPLLLLLLSLPALGQQPETTRDQTVKLSDCPLGGNAETQVELGWFIPVPAGSSGTHLLIDAPEPLIPGSAEKSLELRHFGGVWLDFLKAYGSQSSDPQYNVLVDRNLDGIVAIVDFGLLVEAFQSATPDLVGDRLQITPGQPMTAAPTLYPVGSCVVTTVDAGHLDPLQNLFQRCVPGAGDDREVGPWGGPGISPPTGVSCPNQPVARIQAPIQDFDVNPAARFLAPMDYSISLRDPIADPDALDSGDK